MMIHRAMWCLAVLTGLMSQRAAAAEADEVLVGIARDGNRAAIESITSLSCRYDRTWLLKPPVDGGPGSYFTPSGRYWSNTTTYRVQDQQETGVRDMIIRGGKTLIWGYGPGWPKPGLGILPDRAPAGGEMSQYLLFRHPGREVPAQLLFHEILSLPPTLNAVRRVPPVNGGGPGDILIDLTHSGGRFEFRFDPRANYLIRQKSFVPSQANHVRWEDEVLAFSETAPGVFLPTQIEHRHIVKGVPRATVRTTLTEVRVNIPLGADAFRIPNIAGMECVDTIRRVKYKADADGNAAGPEVPANIVPGNPISSAIAFEQFTPSRPSTPWWWYVLGGSVVLLITAWVIARRRGRHDESPVRMPQVTR